MFIPATRHPGDTRLSPAEQLRSDVERDRQLVATADQAGDSQAARRLVRARLATLEARLVFAGGAPR